MRAGAVTIILAGLVLLAACGGTEPKPTAPSQQAARLPERTAEQAAYDLLEALQSSPMMVTMPPGYTAPTPRDDTTRYIPSITTPGHLATGGVLIWPAGPNAVDQISFTVAATADAAATSFALPGAAMGPPAESFTPSEFSVPAQCRVVAATQVGVGGYTGCSALVGTVIVAVVTRRHPGLSRDNTADAVALLRVGIAQLQAVQAEQARLAAMAPATRVVRVGLLAQSWTRELRGDIRMRLGELGWVPGRNLALEYRFFEDRPERLPELAADLVRSRVDVIMADDAPAARAARDATAGTTIPVIFLLFEDPVAAGLVQSYARPGGNLTGANLPTDPSLSAKRLELLSEALPAIRRIGVLVDAPRGQIWDELEQVARARGLELLPLAVRNRGELAGALADGAAAGAQALLTADSVPYSYLDVVTQFAQAQRLPMVHNGPAPRSLLWYSPSVLALWRKAADQVDSVLRGTKPAQIPVEQVKEFDLSINLDVAQTLGLTIAPAVLSRANSITDPGTVRPRRVR